MTKLALAFALLAACGGGSTSAPAPTGPEAPTSTTEAPTSSTDSPGAPAGKRLGCEAELALQCGDGYQDGCIANVTSAHVCVKIGETAGPPCEQEIAKVCAEGEVDSCLATPPYGGTHVCVKP